MIAPRTLGIAVDPLIHLATDLYEPWPERPRGTVLIRTPYDRVAQREHALSWVRRGFRVAVQDVRGRYGSPGNWHPYRHEGTDGGHTLIALDRLGLIAGDLLLVGASYDAHCALEAARWLDTHPAKVPTIHAVIAMVPALGLWETAHDPDGIPRLRDRIGWWHQHGFARTSRAPLSPNELDRRVEQARRHGVASVISPAEYGAEAPAAWQRLWDARPLDLAARYGGRTTTLLVIGGDTDFFSREAHLLARAWAGGRTGFLTGPWGHGLTQDLDPDTARVLRAHGGLMARIEHVLGDTAALPSSHRFTGDPEAPWLTDEHTPSTQSTSPAPWKDSR